MRPFNSFVSFKDDWNCKGIVWSLYMAVGDEVREKGVGEKGRKKGIKKQ